MIDPSKIPGLKRLRKPKTNGERTLCLNCGCERYNPCKCTHKEKK
jgi:hypothetical protein